MFLEAPENMGRDLLLGKLTEDGIRDGTSKNMGKVFWSNQYLMANVLILLKKRKIVGLRLFNGIEQQIQTSNGNPNHVDKDCTNSDHAMNHPYSWQSRIKMWMMEVNYKYATKRTHQCIGESKAVNHDDLHP